MLLRTMFLLAFIMLLAETIVHGAGALGAASLHRRAIAAARAQLLTAVAREQQTIARAIAGGADPRTAAQPSTPPTCVLQGSSGCTMLAQATIAVVTAAPAVTPSGCPDTACVIYLQANDTVAENRIATRITAAVTAADGTILATRSASAVFRTFDVPPYATLAGSLDATLNDITANGTGDDGGSTSGATTLVNVQYRNALDPAASPVPANVWQAQVQHPASSASAWDY